MWTYLTIIILSKRENLLVSRFLITKSVGRNQPVCVECGQRPSDNGNHLQNSKMRFRSNLALFENFNKSLSDLLVWIEAFAVQIMQRLAAKRLLALIAVASRVVDA